MRLKYIFPLLVAMLAVMVSCEKESDVTLLKEIRVSSSYVAIPEAGGSQEITVTATDEWTLEKVATEKDPVDWLDISATSGNVGESKLTFKAEKALDGRTAEVLIKSGGVTQRINVIQGESKVSESSVAEAMIAPDGKTLILNGTITKIENTEYGNWYLTDDTGSILIYGTLDAKGQTKNFLSLGLEVGDDVTIQGPKGTYNGPQMVNVSVTDIRKSLIKVDSVENEVLPIEGGEFVAHLISKGDGVSVDIPEDAKSWLSISSIQSEVDTVIIAFKAEANAGGDRGTTIIFNTSSKGKEYSTETTITQKGSIIKATIAEFLAAEVGDTQYRLTGVIQKITNDQYGNMDISDFTGQTFVYGIKDFKEKGLNVGDIITIVGKRSKSSSESPRVGDAILENVIPVTPISIADVLTKPDSKEDYYMVTGEITEIKSDLIGRFYFKDASGSTYVFGCSPGYGAVTNEEKNGLFEAKGIKVGDEITVIANKASYEDVGQLSGGFYFGHKSAE